MVDTQFLEAKGWWFEAMFLPSNSFTSKISKFCLKKKEKENARTNRIIFLHYFKILGEKY